MRDLSPLKNWTRVYAFRALTAGVTLLLLGWCFLYRPEFVTWWLRTTMSAIEGVAGLLPYPWGDRVEIALKGFGGSFWIQITAAIVVVRVAVWLLVLPFRKRRVP